MGIQYLQKWYICSFCMYNKMEFNPESLWRRMSWRPYLCVRETKLHSFKYKLIRRIINCNKKLFDMKIKPSHQCIYCDQLDDISHFFPCRNVYGLWFAFFHLWNETNYCRVDFANFPNQQDIVFGVSYSSSVNEVMNFCILHIKFYIYKQRFVDDNS